jgi:amino acid adenylation domain-containing protein
VALVTDTHALTFGALDRRAEALAGRLAAAGAAPEVRVALCLERSIDALVAIFGILRSGAAYLPLDPEQPRVRLEAIARDAGAAALVTREALLPELSGLAPEALAVDARPDGPASTPDPIPTPDPESPAYVIYTSGTTGAGKGVVTPHRAAARFTAAMADLLTPVPGDRLLLFAPLSFDASVLQMFPTLTRGAALVLHPDTRELVGREVLGFCARHRLTLLDLPAALWRQWVEEVAAAGERLPAALRYCLTGGEAVPIERLHRWAGLTDRDVRFLSSYGPTEATVTATACVTSSRRLDELPEAENVPLGRPLAGVTAFVLDRWGQPVPPGVPGELHLGGAGLARGYLGRPGLTAESFVPDPVSGEPGGRLYRTGDLARHLRDGDLEFLGRADHQVKLRGFRLELAEVEGALRLQPGVREAVAVVREDAPGDRRLVAYAVPEAAEGEPDPAALRLALSERLPRHAVPSDFVILEELPVLPSGKVDRAALPRPARDRSASGAERVAPRDALERVLAGSWAQVLGVEEIGVLDDFFELGGHSLLATQVVGRIREELEVELDLRHLFEAPTVAGLAAALRRTADDPERLERTADLVVRLAEMSDEEVEEMLLAETDAPSTEGSPR